jgi:hypothetical protein
MSEPDLTSDKVIGKSLRNVRTWVNFGQNQYGKPEKCPNLGQLRTKSVWKAGEMSEPGSTSDKINEKSQRNVRTWSDFGQNHRKEFVKCPNLV